MRKNSFFTCLVAMVLCMAMLLTGCSGIKMKDLENDTDAQMNNAISNTLKAIMNAEATPSEIIRKALQQGEMTVEMKGILKNTLYSNAAEKYHANHLIIQNDDQVMNVELFMKDKEVAIRIPEYFGEGAYGINFATLENDLKNSNIWAMMDTTYEEFMEENGEAVEALLSLLEDKDNTNSLKKELEAVFKGLDRKIEKTKVEINGKKVKAYDVTYQVSKEDIKEFIDVIISWAEKTLKESDFDISDIGTLIGENVGSVFTENEETEVDIFEALREEINEGFAEIDFNATLTASLNRKTGHIMQMKLDGAWTVDGENGKADLKLVLGEKPAESNQFSLTGYLNHGKDNKIDINVKYTETESAFGYAGSLDINVTNGEDPFKMNIGISLNKENKYTLKVTVDGETVEFAGEYKLSASEFAISIDTMKQDGEQSDIGLRFEAKTTTTRKPTMPEYVNLVTITVEQLQKLVEDIEKAESERLEPEEELDMTIVEYERNNTFIFDDGSVKIEMAGMIIEEEKMKVEFKIENKTEHNLIFTTDDMIVNGITVGLAPYMELPANETITHVISLSGDEFSITGIQKIGYVECPYAYIYDAEDYNDYAQFAFRVNFAEVQQDTECGANPFYEGKYAKMQVKAIQKTDFGYACIIRVENKGERHLIIDIDDIFVNGTSVYGFEYATAYRDTVTYIAIYLEDMDSGELDLSKLEEIRFTVELSDSNYDEIDEFDVTLNSESDLPV